MLIPILPEVNLLKVISGAQNGTDQASLQAAKQLGLATGGWMPKGCITLDGPRFDLLEEYGMQEHPKKGYPPRTEQNIIDSDGTLRFATNWSSTGEKCTLKNIEWHNKPYFDVDINKPCNWFEVYQWLAINNIKILNVAGNSEKTSPGITEKVFEYLTILFVHCLSKENIENVLREKGFI